MSVITNNAYGKISTSSLAIAKVASHTAMESYGIVGVASRNMNRSLVTFWRRNRDARGVKVIISGNKIYLDVYVYMKYGVSINAVAESLKEAIKYKVEAFTGMLVDVVNVNIVDIKL